MVKIMENPIKMDDLGGFPHYFWFNTHISMVQASRSNPLARLQLQSKLPAWELGPGRKGKLSGSQKNLGSLEAFGEEILGEGGGPPRAKTLGLQCIIKVISLKKTNE